MITTVKDLLVDTRLISFGLARTSYDSASGFHIQFTGNICTKDVAGAGLIVTLVIVVNAMN